MIRTLFMGVAFLISSSFQAQISTTYSLSHHAITFKSDRAEIIVDPAITFKYLSSDSYSGVDNIRGAIFTAKIDENFTAAGSLFERQSTLSPFMSEFARQGTTIPGWGQFKPFNGSDWNENPRTIDIARATGYLAWSKNSMLVKVEIGTRRFGWNISPLILSNTDVPYPSLNFIWQKAEFFTEFSINQWVGSKRDGAVGGDYIIRNINQSLISTSSYSNKDFSLALLLGHTIEPSITMVSLAGRFMKRGGFVNYELATSSTSSTGPSYQIGAGFEGSKFITGLNLSNTKEGLYGEGEEAVWSNAEIPLGVVTGNNTVKSSVFFTFKTPAKDSEKSKWYLNCEAGKMSNMNFNFSTFTKGSITRIFSQDWDMGLTISIEAFKGHETMLGIGVVHGIIRNYDELLIP